MPNTKLLPHRQNHVFKIYNEIEKYVASSAPDRKAQKNYFLDLVTESSELNECEKNYCKEMFIRNFELHNVIHKFGEPMECKNCKSVRYSVRYCEVCIKQQLQRSFGTWTSENAIVDEFIQKCQLISSVPPYIIEWIPFKQFKDVEYLTKGGFSTVYTATWTRGSIYDWDENKKMFIYFEYFGPQKVVLKSLNNSINPGKDFFDEAINYFKIQSNSIVYCHGITRFPENGNYMIVMNRHPEGNLRNYLKICNGLRPLLLQNIPTSFARIMQECWNTDPRKRPTIEELFKFANNELVNVYKDGKFDNTISLNSALDKINKSHPFSYSSSRILTGVIPESIGNSNYVTSQYDLTLPDKIS
ncbi:1243_t:CDS:2 [Cetraspora pellucida]|uniref:1243_t:CDS:1 n=1 Tax=Cetraspora pellucida TaxID=1433469 RepID=A0A9N8WDJ6_9GLOM|nr:1243_t:CDS:2 [Cetraspora pellucida]